MKPCEGGKYAVRQPARGGRRQDIDVRQTYTFFEQCEERLRVLQIVRPIGGILVWRATTQDRVDLDAPDPVEVDMDAALGPDCQAVVLTSAWVIAKDRQFGVAPRHLSRKRPRGCLQH